MIKRFLTSLSCLMCINIAQAQQITIKTDDATERRVMVVALDNPNAITELTASGNIFKGSISESKYGFYNIISVKGHSQIILPVHLPTSQNTEICLNLTDKSKSMIDGSNDNKALAAYSKAFIEKNRTLWENRNKGAEACKNIVTSFITSADSIAKEYNCSDKINDYLKIWSYISASDAYSSLPRILGIKTDSMPYKSKDILPEPHKMLDTPLAALFPNTPNIVYASIPNKSNLDSALIYLDTCYTDIQLKNAVKNNIATRYVSRYNYSVDFEKGLERIRKATEKYGLDPKFAVDFERRKATVPGQPFPANVVLKDTLGNVVDFAQFRGKYVYIDVWASWCVPCCREVPQLQKMERELKNDKVVFVSISVDAKEVSWRQKMKQLNMHGNQLLNPGNTLCEALNVKGIPFFVIYDPEGKLYMHGAPRPSQGPGVVELLESLK